MWRVLCVRERRTGQRGGLGMPLPGEAPRVCVTERCEH